MNKPISSGLKYTFLVHFIVGLLFGLVYLLVPGFWLNIAGIPAVDDLPYRLIGAAILGFSASSWLSYKAAVVAKVKILVLAEIVWTVLATLVILYALIFQNYPAIGWMNAVIMAAFAIAWIVFNPKE
jgi:hypothetical protein